MMSVVLTPRQEIETIDPRGLWQSICRAIALPLITLRVKVFLTSRGLAQTGLSNGSSNTFFDAVSVQSSVFSIQATLACPILIQTTLRIQIRRSSLLAALHELRPVLPNLLARACAHDPR